MARQVQPPQDDFDDGGTPAWRARNADYLRSLDARKRRSIWSKPRNQKEAVGDALKIVLIGAGCIVMFFGCYLLAGFVASLIQSG